MNVTDELSYVPVQRLDSQDYKESDRCDLCKALWMAEGRFKTEKELPEQTMGHIQHTSEALSVIHIDSHHQWIMLVIDPWRTGLMQAPEPQSGCNMEHYKSA